MYINLLTDDYIPSEAVVHESSNGLTYYENGCWKFLEKGEYAHAQDGTGESGSVRVEVYKDSMGHVINAPESSEKETYRFYTNYFGLNSFDTERREFAKTSGVVTEAISVKKGVPLKLYADVQCGDGASVEFSVMDGARELSVVPVGTTRITKERMFLGLPQRFPGTDDSYYRNGEPISKPSDEQFADGATYCHSYNLRNEIPDVTPTHDEVRVKVVFRVYNQEARMPEVSNIRIEQEAA